MVVRHNGREFAVSFQYRRNTLISQGNNPPEEKVVIGKAAFPEPQEAVGEYIDWTEFLTACKIEERLGKGDYKLVATGLAIKHPKDPVVKAIGRRVSLAMALSKEFPRVNENGAFNQDNFEFRKAVWAAYFKNHKDGKTIAMPSESTEVGC